MKVLALRQLGSAAGFAPTALRLIIGIIFTAHGWDKLQGGPENFAGFLTMLNVPAPEIMAWVVTLLELVGGILLIVGVLTRLVGVLFVLLMVATTLLVKVDVGLIAADPPGAELDLALLAGALAIALLGPGKAAVDNKIGLGDTAKV
ncbi:MAG: DoxX family protein [Actinomycetota bacterium]